jgi:DNA-binding NtrC family response regulator
VILSPEPLIPSYAFDGQRFGLTAASAGPMVPRLVGDLSLLTGSQTGPASGASPMGGLLLTSLNIANAETLLIERALEAAKGNRTRAAELLGMSVRTLRSKLNGERAESA